MRRVVKRGVVKRGGMRLGHAARCHAVLPVLFIDTRTTLTRHTQHTPCEHFRKPCQVLGDHGKLYVPAELVAVYAAEVLPAATVLTPNQFEAEALTGLGPIASVADAARACLALHDAGPEASGDTPFLQRRAGEGQTNQEPHGHWNFSGSTGGFDVRPHRLPVLTLWTAAAILRWSLLDLAFRWWWSPLWTCPRTQTTSLCSPPAGGPPLLLEPTLPRVQEMLALPPLLMTPPRPLTPRPPALLRPRCGRCISRG